MVLTAHPEAGRGQLLIVGGVALALLLIGLALAMNTAVFAEVHVGQTSGGSGDEESLLRLHDDLDRFLVTITPDGPVNHTDFDELTENTSRELTVWEEAVAGIAATDGQSVSVTLSRVEFISHIVQNESASFEDHQGRTDWTLAANVDRIHRSEMTVQAGALAPGCNNSQGCFQLDVTGQDGNAWRMNVSEPDTSEDIAVTIELANGTQESFSTTDSEVNINLTAGTIQDQNGTHSFTSFLDDPGLDPSYTIGYTNADNVRGTYNLSVHGKVVDETIAADDRYDVNESPRIDPEIAALIADVDRDTPRLSTTTTLRITNGDRDG